jgi:uncharacterized membrane protein (UPF0136 family)
MTSLTTTPVPPVPPPGSVHLNSALGGLTAIGGVMGYLKKGSVPSLMAGSVCGALLIGSGILITNKNESFQGHALASGVTGAMTIGMGQRFITNGKFMPAGLVATLGAAGLAYNIRKTIESIPEY